MDFKLILLFIFNSHYWLYFILIFYVYDSKCLKIYAFSFIYRILVLVVFTRITFKVSFFFLRIMTLLHHHRQRSSLLFFLGIIIFYECDHLFRLLLPSAIFSQDFLLSPYIIRKTLCPSPFSIWWWTMPGKRSGCSTAYAACLGHSGAKKKARSDSGVPTSGGWGCWRRTRRPQQTIRPALIPAHWPQFLH